jgi:hypothetical protein
MNPGRKEMIEDINLLLLLISNIRKKHQQRLEWSKRLQVILHSPKTVHNRVLLQKHLEKKAI